MQEKLRVCREHAWRVVLMILCVAVCVFFSERARIEHEALGVARKLPCNCIVFYRIPKTGSTSMTRALSSIFHTACTNKKQSQCFAEHIGASYPTSCCKLIVLRHALERVKSAMLYHKLLTTPRQLAALRGANNVPDSRHACCACQYNNDMTRFLVSPIYDHWSNEYCFFIPKQTDIAKAVTVLRTFDFVCWTDALQECVNKIAARQQVPAPRVPHVTYRAHGVERGVINNKQVLAEMHNRNLIDIMLIKALK